MTLPHDGLRGNLFNLEDIAEVLVEFGCADLRDIGAEPLYPLYDAFGAGVGSAGGKELSDVTTTGNLRMCCAHELI